MTDTAAIGFRPTHIKYIVGYCLTSTWATALLFSTAFTLSSSSQVVTSSMLSGVVACIGLLLLRHRLPAFDGRTAFSAIAATAMSAGTFLCTAPSFSSIPAVNAAGLVLSGFFAIVLIMAWFSEYARLGARLIVLLAGCSLLASALACYGILQCPVELGSGLMTLIPLVSYALLPKPPATVTSEAASVDATSTASFMSVLSEAVSKRTLLGVVIVFFVIGSIGAIAPNYARFEEALQPAFLLVPLCIALFFVGSAFVVKDRFDASILYKTFLAALAALVFLVSYLGEVSASLVFYSYIMADVLLWTVLLLSAKATPVAPWAVFGIGWLAECLGNVLGHNIAPFIADTPAFLGVMVMLIIVAVGFAFSDGLFVLDLEEGDKGTGSLSHSDLSDEVGRVETPALLGADIADDAVELDAAKAAIDEPSPTLEERIAKFAADHGLSRRETDVFALWVTGHGLKYIQDTLFISESTVKTHMRSIYRKCDVHNRAEIIALFEA